MGEENDAGARIERLRLRVVRDAEIGGGPVNLRWMNGFARGPERRPVQPLPGDRSHPPKN
jgi:hypothetical protein